MSNVLVKQLVEAQIIGAGVLYAAPALTVATIQSSVLVNTTGAPVACTVYITAAAGAPAAANTFVNVTVPAGKPYLCPELINQKVSAGHEIHAAGAGVTIAIGGAEVSGQ